LRLLRDGPVSEVLDPGRKTPRLFCRARTDALR